MEKMKKWYKSHQKPALIGTITILLLLIGYLAGRIYFNDKFLKGTVINDCSVETLSLKQANQKLEKQVSSKSLTLVFNDGQSEVLQSAQLSSFLLLSISLPASFKMGIKKRHRFFEPTAFLAIFTILNFPATRQKISWKRGSHCLCGRS